MNEKKKFNVVSVPTEALTTITINGGFYQRLNKLLIDHADSVDEKELLAAFLKIKRNLLTNDKFAYNLETLMMFLKELEESFKKDGMLVDNEVEIELPKGLETIRTGLAEDDANEQT